LECDLFDRNGEAPDQSCYFVQVLGIMFFNSLREPNQAFVITQGRDVAGDNRWNGPAEDGLGFGHGITSGKTVARLKLVGKSVFLTLASRRESVTGSRFADRSSRRKPMWRQGYPACRDAGAGRPISSFARPGGFVIRCRVRTIGFAIPR
jgi:hypothetical protein